jgi:protein TonB
MAQTLPNPALDVPNVSSWDRLTFTLFLAAVFHGLLIFGIAFELSQPGESAPSVTVTLATHETSEEPEEADFVAQSNQIGSGTLEEMKQITTDQISTFSSENIQETQLLNETKASVNEPVKNEVITTLESEQKAASEVSEVDPEVKKEGEDSQDARSLTHEIASLNAKLDKQRQQYAKRPRERVLTSVSAKASVDAAYLNEWTRKVEAVGNQNFPKEAISQRITGNLRLQTVIKWDGSLIKAEVLDSSGHTVLDAAALQIIRRAAPFLPFPPEIRKDTDQLVIIRTWHFEINGLSTSR